MKILLIALLCALASAQVNEIAVLPGPLSRVNDAIASSKDDDIIIMLPGLYTGCDDSININKKVTIKATDAVVSCSTPSFSSSNTINPTSPESIFQYQGSAIVTLRNGVACNGAVIDSLTVKGARIAVSLNAACKLFINNITIIDCGTGISAESIDGQLTLTSSYISNCSERGIWAHRSHLEVSDSVISGGGGGVAVSQSEHVILRRCKLIYNRAVYGGGLAVLSNAHVMIYDTDICNNVGDVEGGGVYVNSSSAYFNGTSISHNFASSGAGLSCRHGSTCALQSSNLIENDAHTGHGGAVYVDDVDSNILIEDVTLTNNIAGDGGGIYMDAGARAVVSHTMIKGNVAVDGSGGGVHCNDTDGTHVCNITMESASLTLNNASHHGGGLYAGHMSVVNITASNFTRNHIGGLYKNAVDVSDTVMIDNRSIICGNDKFQVLGVTTTSLVNICGTIDPLSYHNDHNKSLYPGMDVSVDGNEMVMGDDDYIHIIIVGTSASLLHTHAPFLFHMPMLDESYYGPLVSMSVDGRRSQTYDYYEYVSQYLGDCIVTVVSGPSIDHVPVHLTRQVTYIIRTDCSYLPTFYCRFGSRNVVASANMSMVICDTPIYDVEESVTLVLEAAIPGHHHNLSSTQFHFTMKCDKYIPPTGYTNTIDCSDMTWGDVCELRCNVGYSGHPESPFCLSDGTWTTPDGCNRAISLTTAITAVAVAVLIVLTAALVMRDPPKKYRVARIRETVDAVPLTETDFVRMNDIES